MLAASTMQDLRELIAAEAAAAAGRLDPAAGVMVQAVWFDAGAARSGRLLLTIHHLAVDGVSWRILVPDLAAAWQAIAGGQAVALPPRGTSFRRWAERLAAHARDASVTAGAFVLERGTAASLRCCWCRTGSMPSRDTMGTAGHLTLTLPAAVTQALLTRVACGVPWRHRRRAADRACGCGCGLVPAACRGGERILAWRRSRAAASHAVLLDLEGHGREEAFGREEGFGGAEAAGSVGGVDLTRTVGWFTSLYPVRLDPGSIDLEEALSGGAALGRALKTIKEQLRAVPGKGLGYGLLRYLNGETAAQLGGLPVPQLGFNYLGRFAAGPMARTGRRHTWMTAGTRPVTRGWPVAIRRCRLRMSSRSTR